MTSDDRRDLGRPRGSVVTAVASSAFAAFAVLALVGVLILAFGASGTQTEQARRAQERVAEPRLTAVPEPAVVTRPEPAAEPAAESAAEPTAAATEDPAEEPASPPAAEPAAEPAQKPAAPARSVAEHEIEVVVLNETKRTGIAAEFRDLLEKRGWTVKRIGDFRGNVPLSTVYYPPGFKAEAEALAAEFPQVDRIRPAFPGAPKTRLTVILCKDYPQT